MCNALLYADIMYDNPRVIKIIEILTWASLLLLVPLALLGFLSEWSLPGQPLYALKRGIENLVVNLDVFDKNALALYKVYLVDRRFNETEKMLSDKTILLNTSQVNDFLSQIHSAEDTINSISNPEEKKVLQQQLLQQISDYRDQLSMLQNQPPLPSQQIDTTSIPSISPDQQITNIPSQDQNQNSQIDSLNQQLQQLQNQIQQNQNNPPPPAGSTTPTPTITQSPSIITPTVYPPTATPTINFMNSHYQVSPSPSVTQTSPCGCFINGFPFIDTNGNGKYNSSSDAIYTFSTTPQLTFSLYNAAGAFITRITQNPGQTLNPNYYSFNKLPANTTYTVKLDSIPQGYRLTTSQSYTVQLGIPCNTGGNPNALCNGNVNQLDFGLQQYNNYNNNSNNNSHSQGNWGGD